MLTSLRSWLAELLRPSRELPAPAPPPAAPVVSAAKGEGDATRNQRRLERRRHEAEGRAEKAEQRVARAEKARKAAEARASSLESELAAAKQRAASAEAQLKKSADARPKKSDQARGRPDAGEKLRALEARLRTTEARAAQAERALADTEARLAAARATAPTAEAAPTVEAASPTGSALRRGAPRTKLDVHFSPGDECLIAICRQIEQTERTVDVCVFTITDDRISNCLLDAHRRGVAIRIITDNDKALDEGSDVHRLARAGIEVREDQTPFHMHHKFAVFDGSRMITGSYNWTRGAARNNHENVVVSDDARLIGPFGREFAALWDELGRG